MIYKIFKNKTCNNYYLKNIIIQLIFYNVIYIAKGTDFLIKVNNFIKIITKKSLKL